MNRTTIVVEMMDIPELMLAEGSDLETNQANFANSYAEIREIGV